MQVIDTKTFEGKNPGWKEYDKPERHNDAFFPYVLYGDPT